MKDSEFEPKDAQTGSSGNGRKRVFVKGKEGKREHNRWNTHCMEKKYQAGKRVGEKKGEWPKFIQVFSVLYFPNFYPRTISYGKSMIQNKIK